MPPAPFVAGSPTTFAMKEQESGAFRGTATQREVTFETYVSVCSETRPIDRPWWGPIGVLCPDCIMGSCHGAVRTRTRVNIP